MSGILFNADAGATVLDGNPVELSGGIENQSTKTQTIHLPLTLVGSQTIDTSSGKVAIAGSIDQSSGNSGITKTGSGTLVLSGANSFTGGVQVLSGTLVFGAPNSIPAGSSLSVGSFPLIVTAADWTSAGLTLKIGNDSDLHVFETGTTTDAIAPVLPTRVGNIEIASPSSGVNLTIDSTNGNPIPAGGLNYSGPGGLIKTGPGTVVLHTPNTFSGGVQVLAGSLVFASAAALPSGSSLMIGNDCNSIFNEPQQVSIPSDSARDAVLQSLDLQSSAEKFAAAALWDFGGSSTGGPLNRRHDSSVSAVDAVMAVLKRT